MEQIDNRATTSAELAVWCAQNGVRFVGAAGVRELPARFKVPIKVRKAGKLRAKKTEAEYRLERERIRTARIVREWQERDAMPNDPITLHQCPALRFARLVKVGNWWMPPRNVRPHSPVVGVRWARNG